MRQVVHRSAIYRLYLSIYFLRWGGRAVRSVLAHSLELLVLPGCAYLGRVALGQLVQAPGVLQLELGLAAEEVLQVLQQLQPGLGLLLQTPELLHQLVTDFCAHKEEPLECHKVHWETLWTLVDEKLSRGTTHGLGC